MIENIAGPIVRPDVHHKVPAAISVKYQNKYRIVKPAFTIDFMCHFFYLIFISLSVVTACLLSQIPLCAKPCGGNNKQEVLNLNLISCVKL
jgi:hypothetical protein